MDKKQRNPETVEPQGETLFEDEDGKKTRVYHSKFAKYGIVLLAIGMSLYHIYGLCIHIITPEVFFGAHWGLGMILTFLLYPATPGARTKPLPFYDLLAAALSAAIMIYIALNYEGMMLRSIVAAPTKLELVMGVLAILITLEAARRTIGIGLPIVAVVLMLYGLLGGWLPGVLANRNYSPLRLVSYLFSTEGIFGIALKMSATNVFLLVLFGAFLTLSGAGDFFMRLAMSVAGGSRGGPAKVSVLSSALFGSISGSAVANVVSTGTFTIPLMKKVGYRKEFAGAVEAVASTGGQIMPPIMGSGAFIMAEMLGLPFGSIALAALVPALLYYYSVFVAIDLEASKMGLDGVKKEDLERPLDILKKGWYLLIPILVLIYFLAVQQASVSRSAIFGIIACVVCSFFNKENRMGPKKILEALETGSMRSVTVITAVACAGLAIGIVMLSGLGMKFTLIITSLSGSSLFLSLVFSALAALILGMGLPTVAAYIICASLLSAGLIGLGLTPIATHMFLFYYSILSMITPPVALAAYAAGNLADANPNKVGFESMRLGAIAFVLPFFFIYGPSLLLVGTPVEIIVTIITAFIGINCFTIALFGFFMKHTLTWLLRIMLLVGGLCMVLPGLTTDFAGLALLVVAVFLFEPTRNKLLRRSTAA